MTTGKEATPVLPAVRASAVGIAVALVALATGWWAVPAFADGVTDVPAFSGAASAVAVQMTVHVPGAPLADTPVDGGGPTAQVAVDSLGSSKGYAAFPDPGALVITAPGLVAGAAAGGLLGLPPLALSPPDYPLFVSSDAASAPFQSAGAGPYRLTAESGASSSAASAQAGFREAVAGNAALLSSRATLTSTTERTISSATTDAQALTVGPLTIGEIKSVATEVMDRAGEVKSSTSLEISAARVGGVPVSVSPGGLIAGGTTAPLPIDRSLAGLLAAARVSVRVLQPQKFRDRVIAPAVEITAPFAMPFAVPNVGQLKGTMTATFGGATALLTRTAPDVANDLLAGSDAGAQSPMESAHAPDGTAGVVREGSSPRVVAGALPLFAAISPRQSAAGPGRRLKHFDIETLYLVVAGGGLVVLLMGQFVRRVLLQGPLHGVGVTIGSVDHV